MESMDNNKMDEQIKVKFDDFAPPVPTDLWNKIESQLDVEQTVKPKPIKRIRFSYSVYGTAVAATLLIAFAFWKFGEPEIVVQQRDSKEYTSEILSGAIESAPVDGKEEQESVSKSSPIVAVKKSIEVVEGLTPKSQTVEVKLSTKTNVEISQREIDYNVIYAESTFSISGIDKSMARQGVLPLESESIALQERAPLHEEIQDSLTEEISLSKNKKIGVSTVLNFLAKGLSSESGKSIEFSESEEGILKLDLKLGFAKSND